MLQIGTVMKIADNSGAKEAKLIGIPGASKTRYARIGDVIVVSIQKTTPNTGVKDHEVHKAVIVRTTKEL